MTRKLPSAQTKIGMRILACKCTSFSFLSYAVEVNLFFLSTLLTTRGEIGLSSFAFMVTDPRLRNIPLILETHDYDSPTTVWKTEISALNQLSSQEKLDFLLFSRQQAILTNFSSPLETRTYRLIGTTTSRKSHWKRLQIN